MAIAEGWQMSTTTPKLAAFDATNAMLLLWQRASDLMTEDELNWFAEGAPELVQLQAGNLADIASGLGCLIDNDQTSGAFSERSDVAGILWSIAHQVGVLGSLAQIGGYAASLARYRASTKAKGGRAAP
jgi:hypothetical protein